MSRSGVLHQLSIQSATAKELAIRLDAPIACVRSDLHFLVFAERRVRARPDGLYELGEPDEFVPTMKEHI